MKDSAASTGSDPGSSTSGSSGSGSNGSGSGSSGSGSNGSGSNGSGGSGSSGSGGSGSSSSGSGGSGSSGSGGSGSSSSGSGGSGSGGSGSSGSGSGGSGSGSGSGSSGSGPYVASNAVNVGGIQALNNWIAVDDPGTTGSANGAMAIVGSPSLSGNALEFYTTYTYFGGELYYASFGDDVNASNFVYDAWVYLDNSSGSIANLEMDMNQVIPNGQTVIFGLQCDGWAGTWDYTENAGTPNAPIDHWVHSEAPCNVQTWAQNSWHHVQASYSRDDDGNVTYQSVWLDGNEQQINATVPSAFALGWARTLLTNFQVDSIAPGLSSSTVYVDNLTISRW